MKINVDVSGVDPFQLEEYFEEKFKNFGREDLKEIVQVIDSCMGAKIYNNGKNCFIYEHSVFMTELFDTMTGVISDIVHNRYFNEISEREAI